MSAAISVTIHTAICAITSVTFFEYSRSYFHDHFRNYFFASFHAEKSAAHEHMSGAFDYVQKFILWEPL